MAKGYKETLLTKAPSLFLGQKKTDISVVTGRKPHRKRSKKETDKLGIRKGTYAKIYPFTSSKR